MWSFIGAMRLHDAHLCHNPSGVSFFSRVRVVIPAFILLNQDILISAFGFAISDLLQSTINNLQFAMVHAIVISFARYTSWIAFSSSIPSFNGFLKAFRPEIKPCPLALLLMTAVATASANS